jgi:hypothetical protein
VKKLVYDMLTVDAGFTAIIPAARFVERGTLVGTDPLSRPFATYSVTSIVRNPHGGGSSFLEVFVYDDRGSYEQITSALRAARAALSNFAERKRTRSDGSVVRLVEAYWQGEGPELFDELLEAGLRSSSWQLIGSGQ